MVVTTAEERVRLMDCLRDDLKDCWKEHSKVWQSVLQTAQSMDQHWAVTTAASMVPHSAATSAAMSGRMSR